jgi:hypothetical protein
MPKIMFLTFMLMTLIVSVQAKSEYGLTEANPPQYQEVRRIKREGNRVPMTVTYAEHIAFSPDGVQTGNSSQQEAMNMSSASGMPRTAACAMRLNPMAGDTALGRRIVTSLLLMP